jgi:hypothetical protein
MPRKPDPRPGTRYGDGMKTLTFKVHEDIANPLGERAEAEGVPVGAVIREALVAYLGLPPDTTRVAGRSDR